MCLIIAVPKGKSFPKDALEAAYYTNEDGVGTMYAHQGRVIVKKNPSPKFEDVKAMFEELQGRQFVMHLRFKTHGDKDLDNTHPFQVLSAEEHGRDLYLMHNGVISCIPQDEHTKSDTWHFVNRFLRPILARNPRLIYDAKFQEVLGKIIGLGSKLVLLDGFGRMVFINRKEGAEHASGCWISNTYSINNAKIYRSKNITADAKKRLGLDDKPASNQGTLWRRPYAGWHEDNTDYSSYGGGYSYTSVDTGYCLLTKLQAEALEALETGVDGQRDVTNFCPMVVSNLADKGLIGSYKSVAETPRLFNQAKGRRSLEHWRKNKTTILDEGEANAYEKWLKERLITDNSVPPPATADAPKVVPLDAKRETVRRLIASAEVTSALQEIDRNIKQANEGKADAACDDMCQLYGRDAEAADDYLNNLSLEDIVPMGEAELFAFVLEHPEAVVGLLQREAEDLMEAYTSDEQDDEDAKAKVNVN